MFAGNYVLADNLGVNKILLTLISVVLTFIFVTGNVNAISRLNTILMPIIIMVLVYFSFTTNRGVGEDSSLTLGLLSAINYALINFVPMGVFILDIHGDKKLSKKEIILTAGIVSIILMILLYIYNNAIIVNNLENVAMPILYLIRGDEMMLSVMALMSLYLGMLTTLISCVFIFSNYINNYIKNYKHSTMLSIILGLIISFLGFNAIVNYVYVIIGLIGLFTVIFTIKQEIRSSKNRNFLYN